jgi:multicomponent Na+:H+ antiporter subunit D
MTMPEALSPAFLLLFAAAFVAVLPRALGPTAFVAAFLGVLAQLTWGLEPGTVWTSRWLGFDLTPLSVDRLNRIFALAFALVGVAGGLYAWHMRERCQQAATLIYAAGAMGVLFAGDLMTLIVFWELMAVASTYLVLAGRRPASRGAALRYIMVHAFGGAVLLGGILWHAGQTGSFAFAAFDVSPATVLILIGFAINTAIPPLHGWLPDAYPEASVTGMVFLSALTTKTAVYTLLRGFAGWDVLIYGGVFMALYGVVYAVLENDTRRLLAYHIVSQVGFMVAAAGIGTEMATSGGAAHAFAHVIYKGLLVMGAGAVLHSTGKSKMTELGGIVHLLPAVFGLYMIGGLAISGFPFLSGYVAKNVVIAAAEEAGLIGVALLLYAASIGTFLHTGLKLPYFTWFGPRREMAVSPVPKGMYAGMGVAAVLCVAIGVFHEPFYALLPYAIEFEPYTSYKLVHTAEYLTFTALAFFVFLGPLEPTATVSVDTDWMYRKAGPIAGRLVLSPLVAMFSAADAAVRGLVLAASGLASLGGSRVEWEKGIPIGAALAGALIVFGGLVILGLWQG